MVEIFHAQNKKLLFFSCSNAVSSEGTVIKVFLEVTTLRSVNIKVAVTLFLVPSPTHW